jgi:putative hemolysin
VAAVAGAIAASMMLACGGAGGAPQGSEDERGSVGVPPPAAKYCTDLGYSESFPQSESDASSDALCVFPDGTSCDEWAFYRAQCGQAHSYCNLHGGSVRTDERDAGGFTSVVAVCDLGGTSCTELSFKQSGKCE